MTDETNPRPVARFFGGLLMAVGGLIAVTAGLCSLVVTVIGIGDALHNPDGFVTMMAAGLPMVLGVGGVPFAIGLGIFFGGRALFRG